MIQIKQYKAVKNLLSKGGNAKINKNEITTFNLSLAPYKQNAKYCDLDLLNDSTYKNIIVYDYTAIIGKVKKYLGTRYHLTLSRKEDNEQDVMETLKMGGNVAIVFKEIPQTYKGYRVVDGDKTDLEMTKYKNVVLGLKAKGDAKKDTTGFVI